MLSGLGRIPSGTLLIIVTLRPVLLVGKRYEKERFVEAGCVWARASKQIATESRAVSWAKWSRTPYITAGWLAT